MRSTFFFDIDGCTHPCEQPKASSDGKIIRNESDGLFVWIDPILNMLEKYPDIDLVCHSHWRNRYSFQELLFQLPPGIAERTIDVTQRGIDKYESIVNYSKENNRLIYRIMDDDLWSFPQNCYELIFLPNNLGLSSESSIIILENELDKMDKELMNSNRSKLSNKFPR